MIKEDLKGCSEYTCTVNFVQYLFCINQNIHLLYHGQHKATPRSVR